jgi:hypothetical protein
LSIGSPSAFPRHQASTSAVFGAAGLALGEILSF